MEHKPLFAQIWVDFPQDPRIRRAGEVAELMLVRAFLLAKRIETDGILLEDQVAECAPRYATKRQVADALVGLEAEGLIRENPGGGWYLSGWLNWNPSKAQLAEKRRIDRDRKAKGGSSERNPNGIRTESSRTAKAESERNPEVRAEQSRAEINTSPKVAKPARPLSDFQKLQLALARVEGIEVTDDGKGLSNRDWSRLGKAAKDIADCDPSVSPTSIAAAANRYRTELPNAALTASALASWWTRLKAPKVVARPSGFGFRPNEAS